MVPIRDEYHRERNMAVITLGLLVVNIVVFLYEISLGAGLEIFIRTYGAVPREILLGGDVPPAGPHPLWLQLVTSMFLHGGWLHLLSNMAYLRVFGDSVEEALGKFGYLLFYLGAGVIASLTHVYLSGPGDITPSVGASGAISGVIGAYLVFFPRRLINVFPGPALRPGRLSANVMLGFWFVLQCLNGIAALSSGTAQTGGVAVWAHIGGFLAGLLVGIIIRGRAGVRQRAYA